MKECIVDTLLFTSFGHLALQLTTTSFFHPFQFPQHSIPHWFNFFSHPIPPLSLPNHFHHFSQFSCSFCPINFPHFSSFFHPLHFLPFLSIFILIPSLPLSLPLFTFSIICSSIPFSSSCFHIGFHPFFTHSIFVLSPFPYFFYALHLNCSFPHFSSFFSFVPFSSCHPFHICFHYFLTHSTFVPSLPFSYFSSKCTPLLSTSTIFIICSSTPLLSFPHFHFLSPHHFHPSFIHSTSSFFHQPRNFHAFIFFIPFTFVLSKLSSFFHALHFPPFTCFSSFFHSFHFSPFTHFHFFCMLQFHPFAQIFHFFSTPLFI